MALDFPNSPTIGQTFPNPSMSGVPVWKWDGSEWVPVSSGGTATFIQYEYLAAAGQVSFSGLDLNGIALAYSQGFLEVFINGSKLNKADYAATTGNTVVIAQPANVNDQVTIVVFSTVLIANALLPQNNLSDVANKDQARANIAAASIKNYIVNGAMMVSQENGSTALTANGAYPVDMTYVQFGSGTFTHQQVALRTPAGSPNRLRVTINTMGSIGSADFLLIDHNIEGLRAADLMFGTATAKTITIQFGCKGPAGNYAVSLRGPFSNRSYIAPFTIAAGEANTDVVKSVMIPGDVTGAWNVDNTAAFSVGWACFGGSAFQGAPNVWQAGNFLWPTGVTGVSAAGSVFELFDVGLYAGSVAPAFVVPDFVSELTACKRYFQFLPMYSGGMETATVFWGSGLFPVEMCTAPSLTIIGGSITNGIHLYGGAYLNITSVNSVQYSGRGGLTILNTSAGTAGISGVIYRAASDGLLVLKARL